MADERPSWYGWGMSLAEAAATRADCTRRKVGAVILTSEQRVVSTGYNGAPKGMPGCLSDNACPRGTSNVVPLSTSYDTGPGSCIALHAEQNALLRASWADMQGSTLYVTCEPCPGCMRMIRGTPLASVIWKDEDGNMRAGDL